jgi:hypothetical protein
MKNALKPKAAPVRGKPFVDYHRERGLSRVVDAATMVAYDPATLFFDPATEFTFEELRAQRWLAKHSMSMDDFPMVRARDCVSRWALRHPSQTRLPSNSDTLFRSPLQLQSPATAASEIYAEDANNADDVEMADEAADADETATNETAVPSPTSEPKPRRATLGKLEISSRSASTESDDVTAPVDRQPLQRAAMFTGPEAPRPRGLVSRPSDVTSVTTMTEHTVTKQLDFNTSDLAASALSHTREVSQYAENAAAEEEEARMRWAWYSPNLPIFLVSDCLHPPPLLLAL